MRINVFRDVLSQTIHDIIHHPSLILPGILIWFVLVLIAKLSLSIQLGLDTLVGVYSRFIVVTIITLSVISFILAGLIGMSVFVIRHNRAPLSHFLISMKTYGLRNLFIILIITLIGSAIRGTAHYGALFISRSFDLSVYAAQTLFILVYFIGIAGVLLFLLFPSFYLITENASVMESIRLSRRLVSREYPIVLSMSIIFFIIVFLIDKIQGLLGDSIMYAILVPFVSTLLTRFVVKFK